MIKNIKLRIIKKVETTNIKMQATKKKQKI